MLPTGRKNATGCSKLTDVYCYAENVPTTAADAFEGSPISSGTLLVEDNSVMAYYEATPWGQFGTVMGFNGTTGIVRFVNSMGGGSISVFSLNGNKLAETQGAGLKQVLNTLPKGVYIEGCLHHPRW